MTQRKSHLFTVHAVVFFAGEKAQINYLMIENLRKSGIKFYLS